MRDKRTPKDVCGVACSKRLDSGERCRVKKALLLPRFYFFALLFTSHRSPLSERLEQAICGEAWESTTSSISAFCRILITFEFKTDCSYRVYLSYISVFKSDGSNKVS